jgi:hypothetical protein
MDACDDFGDENASLLKRLLLLEEKRKSSAITDSAREFYTWRSAIVCSDNSFSRAWRLNELNGRFLQSLWDAITVTGAMGDSYWRAFWTAIVRLFSM